MRGRLWGRLGRKRVKGTMKVLSMNMGDKTTEKEDTRDRERVEG